MKERSLIFFILFLLAFPLLTANAQGLKPSGTTSSFQIDTLEEPITDEYVLGPGDRLLLSIKGKVIDVSYELVITADGNIIIPEIGSVYSSGLSIRSLRKKLETLIPKYYKNVQISLSLLAPRTFKVFVTGAVASPGTFTIKALTRLQEAINLAGGILPSGSYRHIQITRIKDNKKKILNIDLYKFYKKGDISQNPYLEAGDVIYVPVMRESVKVLGEVRNPGEYEIVEGDRLKDIIEMAGGLTPKASLVGGTLERIRENKKEVIELKLYDLLISGEDKANIRLTKGDTITIPVKVDRIYVLGQVRNPGSFTIVSQKEQLQPNEVQEGVKVSELIAKAGGILPQASTRRIQLIRDNRIIKELDLYKVLVRGEKEEEEIKLLPGDVIYVPVMRESVKVLGEVRNPGEYEIVEGDRLKDIIEMAGGLTPKASLVGGTLERIRENKKEVIELKLYDLLISGEDKANIRLTKGDTITIPVKVDRIYVLGQVRNPGSFTIVSQKEQLQPNEVQEGVKVSELIAKAGGILPQASTRRIQLIRDNRIIKELDLYRVLVRGEKEEEEIKLLPGDVIYVPVMRESVKVLGEVRNPGEYEIVEGDRLKDIIEMAGGLTPRASLVGGTLERIRENKKEVQDINLYELLIANKEEDTITIPVKVDRIYVQT
jgi:polysaccharide export outer membrane protein